MSRDEMERLLLLAMADGVNRYLNTTKGIETFGANANAIVVDDDLIVTTVKGEFIFFSSTGL